MDTSDGKRRYVVIVTGVEYPRYESLGKGRGPYKSTKKHWALRRGRYEPKQGIWRKKGKSIAKRALQKTFANRAILYDFFRGTRETFELHSGNLRVIKKHEYGPLLASNYRYWAHNASGQIVLRPVRRAERRLSTSGQSNKPAIHYYPGISDLSPDSDVLEAEYFRHFRHAKWYSTGLSFLHVLRVISWIGKHRKYSLLQFHLFGHATGSELAGPVFVNTNDWYSRDPRPRGVKVKKRHPLDQDARAALDFQTDNINKRLFRRAFALGAVSYVWGCNWNRPLHRMIGVSVKAIDGNPQLDQRQKNIVFKYDSTYGRLDRFFHFFDVKKQEDQGERKKIRRSLVFVRKTLREYMEKSYVQQLANASTRCVSGGLPGTYSDNDERRHRGSLLLMHVPMGRSYYRDLSKSSKPDNFQGHMKFYQSQFGTQFGAGQHRLYGRGFAIYKPNEF